MFGVRCPYPAPSHNPNHQILTFLSGVGFFTTQLLTVYFDTAVKGVFWPCPLPKIKFTKLIRLEIKFITFYI